MATTNTMNTSTDSELDAVVVKVVSPLEALPKELLWKVFEYTPEIALDFRLASHTLRKKMDAFALGQSKIPLVTPFSVSDFRLPNSTKAEGQYGLMFDIPKDKSGLFYLRLHLAGHKTFKEDIRLMEGKTDKDDDLVPMNNMFDIDLNVDDADHDEKVEKISAWIGRKIGTAQCQNLYGEKKLEGFTKLLKDTQFVKLKVIADKISDEEAKYLLKTMVNCKVNQLCMTGMFQSTIDTKLLLRQLASCIRSIQINQTEFKPNDPENTENTESNIRRLFGKNDDDWASVIVDMFKGATDKLCITNKWMPGYLTGSQTDRLKEELTKLGKDIWFKATCDSYPEGFETDAYKGYAVKVNPADPPAAGQHNQQTKCKQFLDIIAETRADEKPIDTNFLDEEKKEKK